MRVFVTVQVALLLFVSVGLAPCLAKEPNKVPAEVQAMLQGADSFELFSLDPKRGEKSDNDFHGWRVLGSTVVKEAETRNKLVDALNEGVEENKGRRAFCFQPRHGIRLVKGDKTIDLVICFECYSTVIYGGEDEKKKYFLVTRSPQPTFDEVLKEAKVMLPKPAEKK